MVVIPGDVGGPIDERNGAKRFGTPRRYGYDIGRRQSRQVEVGRWCIGHIQCLTGKVRDIARITQEIGSSGVIDSIASANHGAALEVRNRITESHGWSEVVPVIVPKGFIWIWRMLADELGCGQFGGITTDIGIPHDGKARAGAAEQRGFASVCR